MIFSLSFMLDSIAKKKRTKKCLEISAIGGGGHFLLPFQNGIRLLKHLKCWREVAVLVDRERSPEVQVVDQCVPGWVSMQTS